MTKRLDVIAPKIYRITYADLPEDNKNKFKGVKFFDNILS